MTWEEMFWQSLFSVTFLFPSVHFCLPPSMFMFITGVLFCVWSQDGVDSVVIRLWAGGCGPLIPLEQSFFLSPKLFKTGLLFSGYRGWSSRGIEIGQWPSSIAVDKNEWSYASTSHLFFYGVHRNYCTFIYSLSSSFHILGTGTFTMGRFLFIPCDILDSLWVSVVRSGLIVFFPVMLGPLIITEKNCYHSCRHAV